MSFPIGSGFDPQSININKGLDQAGKKSISGTESTSSLFGPDKTESFKLPSGTSFEITPNKNLKEGGKMKLELPDGKIMQFNGLEDFIANY